MKISTKLLCALGVLLGMPGHAPAAPGLSLEKAYLGIEGYFYPRDGFPGQNHGNFAVTSEFEFKADLSESWKGKITPFVRGDPSNDHRNRFDLREAAIEFANDQWKAYGGMGKVSWSVTESVNIIPYQVVDIVNQRDLAADPSGQEKLGAAMLAGYYQGETTLAQLIVLPWFRKRPFPRQQMRENPLGGAINLDDQTVFTSSASEHRVNAALRLEKQIDSANVAFIQYRGYAPQPVVVPDFRTGGSTSLYYLVDMTGVTAQAAVGSWLLKTEIAYSNTRLNGDSSHIAIPRSYTSSVTGVEYTFVRFAGESDLGILAEWIRDTRGNGANGTPFPRDFFVGARWVANDASDTQVLGGLVRNLDNYDTVYQIQYERRLLEKYWLHVAARAYSAKDESPLAPFKRDNVVYARLKYYF